MGNRKTRLRRVRAFGCAVTCCALVLFAATSFAQQETFDVVSYTAPKASLSDGTTWKKEVTRDKTTFTAVNGRTGGWCQMTIVKSTISKGSLDKDFDSEWQELILKNYKPAGTPTLKDAEESKGWKIKRGVTAFSFDGKEAIATLTTLSGDGRCVSIVTTTNSQDYSRDIQAFLASVDHIQPAQAVVRATSSPSIVGTWGSRQSGAQAYGDYRNPSSMNNYGYVISQYTFNTNGMYSYVSKTFRMTVDSLLLVRERGTYEIEGDSLAVMPQESVTQAWSKAFVTDARGVKSYTDNWGTLLSSQNRALESTTYGYVVRDFGDGNGVRLILQAGKPTLRDGPFNGGDSFRNSWFFDPISAGNPVVVLPGK
jgi:hypothetical protein